MSPTVAVGYTERMLAQSPASFVNRQRELDALASWWERPGGQLALVWGRRRVGKTALLRRFADGRRSLFHVSATRAPAAELELLSRRAAALGSLPRRDLDTRPFSSWDDAFDVLAALAAQEPLLVVLDEFPELVQAVPELPSILRAFWEEARGATQLRMVLCGSAVRVMQTMIEVRAPLYGRFDLVLPVHPFQPHEAALLLADLSPPQRAAVWSGLPQPLAERELTQMALAGVIERRETPAGVSYVPRDGHHVVQLYLALAHGHEGISERHPRLLTRRRFGRTRKVG